MAMEPKTLMFLGYARQAMGRFESEFFDQVHNHTRSILSFDRNDLQRNRLGLANELKWKVHSRACFQAFPAKYGAAFAL